MNQRKYLTGALVAAAAAVAAIWAGVPASTVLLVGLLLACPLMMVFMHGGHGPAADAPPQGDRPLRRAGRLRRPR